MRLSRRRLLAATGTSVVLAGCFGTNTDDPEPPADDSVDDPTPAPADDDTAGTPAADPDPTVQVYDHPDFGEILVGPDEMTLYNFDADTQGEPMSACYDDCAAAWPPLTSDDDPVAGGGVSAELTSFTRDDGARQITANGWPLYYFDGDDVPGDTNGQGINDVWWVLSADGTRITPDHDDDPDDEPPMDEYDARVAVGAAGAFEFDPAALDITEGTTVLFEWEGDHHNIAVNSQPDSAAWEGVPAIHDTGYTHTHTFETPGAYEYMCEPHEGAGMTGTITVSSADDEADPDDSDDGNGAGYY